MAVVIRLKRMGHKKAPYYRLVVADSRSPRDGRFIETVGTYQPVAPNELNTQQTVDTERVNYWLSVGAQPTETAWSILKRSGIKKAVKSGKRKKAKAESA